MLFLLLAASQFAGQNILSIPGKGGIPYFDSLGHLKVAYINAYGGMSLATIQEGKGYTDKISIRNLTYRNNVQFIHIKKDRTGRTWLVWEERYPGKSDIYIAQLKNGSLLRPINLTYDKIGQNFSPNMDFSLENELWTAWINYFQKKYTIVVKNVTADQAWEIHSPLGPSALTPQLIIDGTGKIWLFWVGGLRNRDEILYTHFDGQRWLEPLSLNLNPDVPHITPSISLDLDGFPHVAWSAYDGDDYEIYYSNWDGYKWSQETRIIHNQNISDTFPSISLFLDTIPIVAWLRSSKEKREIYFSYRRDEEWSPEIRISGGMHITASPRLVSSGEKIGILWQDQAEIKIILKHFFNWQEISDSMHRNIESLRVLPLNFSSILDLDRDKYIGYGDSITYGIIALSPAPDLGYVPRLEGLIDANIRDSVVSNQGVGGEDTAAGLARINSTINGEQARTIFIMEGTNDVKDANISIDTTAFNLRKMTERCINFGMIPFLSTILPMQPWEGLIEDRILELNQEIESVAADPDVYFVDQFSSFMNHPNHWYTLLSDSTHPNEVGYQIMAETWYEALVDTVARIEIDKTSLSFEAGRGESNPPAQTFKIRNSGAGRLNFQISVDQQWLSVSPSSGDSTGEWNEIQVSVSASNLTQGTYRGSITIRAENASNSPKVITVQLTNLSPTIGLDKTTLSFEGVQGESNPTVQTFKIRNSGIETLHYQINVNRQWISVSPPSGDSTGEWDEIQVSVNISNLTRGTYRGSITIHAENASNSPQVITVQLTILSPTIGLDKTTLSFEGVRGESNPPPQIFKIRNSGVETLLYQIGANRQWISVSPPNGDSTGEWDEIQVSVNISNLIQGTYRGSITIHAENASNSPRVITVQLTILGPTIELDKTGFSFEGTAGEPDPAPQTFKIRNSGAGTLHFQISGEQEWMSVSPLSGDSSGEWIEVEVRVYLSNLNETTYQGSITISAENASNSPQTLIVNLTIHLPPLFSPLNFHGEKKENKSVSLSEYINILEWQANSKNKFVEKYKIYLVEGENKILLTEVDAQTFVYWHRRVEKNRVYRYGLTAVDKFGRESEVVTIELR